MNALWAAEKRKLERYLRRRLSQVDTDDVVGAAFEKMCKPGREPNPDLLWKIAFNEAANLHRAEAKQDFLERQSWILNGVAISDADTAIFRADFDRALRQLPWGQRAAFVLTELRGLTERETANVLGIDQATVNRRCEAARIFLKGELT